MIQMHTGNIYDRLVYMAHNLVDVNIEDCKEISPLGPGTIREWAICKVLISIILEYMGEYKPQDRLEKALQWLSMDLKFKTNLHRASILPLDEFMVIMLNPINPFAREIYDLYNPNDKHNSNIIEAYHSVTSYKEAINIVVNQLQMQLDDAIEYVRLNLFHPHTIMCPSDENLGYSLENGIVLTVLLVYGIIDFKTFLIYE